MSKGRPVKQRVIKDEPKIRQFSPRGKVGRPDHIELKLEEREAIRLADQLDLSQAEAALFMGVSQQTFSRVLKKARKCLAEALVKGKIIRIKGGYFKLEP
ncbi:MAG: DUF134 domain-containing protein [Candidatus Omnitrophica bacterium]|nr:DUF134 domain-containing protein [Candidatus Omnitrophota bacterium]